MSAQTTHARIAEFESLTSLHEQLLRRSIQPTTREPVVIVAPFGEVAGVESGTAGFIEGILVDLNGRALVAVRLDDNGETVYVPPGACATIPSES